MGEDDWTTQDVIEQRIANAVAENEAKHEAHAKAYAAEVERLKQDLGIANAAHDLAFDERDKLKSEIAKIDAVNATARVGLLDEIAELTAALDGAKALLESANAQRNYAINERDIARREFAAVCAKARPKGKKPAARKTKAKR